MRRGLRRLPPIALAASFAATLVGSITEVRAEPQDAALDGAKRLFVQGIAALDRGELDEALALFERSRHLAPSVPNTMNAALCLDKLGRGDEALDLYGALLADFGASLTSVQRETVVRAIARLQRKLARVDVRANVAATLVVDGRERGVLPLRKPMYVRPGLRSLRLVKDGYHAYDTKVAAEEGRTALVDARLEPLRAAGYVRVEETRGRALPVLVDDAIVGTTPWEGLLPAGAHRVVVADETTGTAPIRAIAIEGQTTLVRAEARPLGSAIRASALPRSSEIFIDGVGVGRDLWEGRLPEGEHTLTVRAAGYVPESRAIQVAKGSPPQTLRWTLVRDPTDPLWASTTPAPRWFLRGIGGVVTSPPEGATDLYASAYGFEPGVFAALRAGITFFSGLKLHFTTGYVSMSSAGRVAPAEYDPYGPRSDVDPVEAFSNRVTWRSVLFAGGAGVELRVAPWLVLEGSVSGGVLVGQGMSRMGAFVARPGFAKLGVSTGVLATAAMMAVIVPELGVRVPIAGFDLGATLGFLYAPAALEAHGLRVISLVPRCDAPDAPLEVCSAGGPAPTLPIQVLARGVIHDPFLLWVPQIVVERSF